MPLHSLFRKAAITAGIITPTDRELMLSCIKALENDLVTEMNFGAHSWLAKRFPSKLQPPVTLKMEITKDEGNHLIAIIRMQHSIFDSFDEFDIKVSVQQRKTGSYILDGNAYKEGPEEYEGPNRLVRIDMPHHNYPRFITTRIDRLEFINFIRAEAEDRVGLDASMRNDGISPPKQSPSDLFNLD